MTVGFELFQQVGHTAIADRPSPSSSESIREHQGADGERNRCPDGRAAQRRSLVRSDLLARTRTSPKEGRSQGEGSRKADGAGLNRFGCRMESGQQSDGRGSEERGSGEKGWNVTNIAYNILLIDHQQYQQYHSITFYLFSLPYNPLPRFPASSPCSCSPRSPPPPPQTYHQNTASNHARRSKRNRKWFAGRQQVGRHWHPHDEFCRLWSVVLNPSFFVVTSCI